MQELIAEARHELAHTEEYTSRLKHQIGYTHKKEREELGGFLLQKLGERVFYILKPHWEWFSGFAAARIDVGEPQAEYFTSDEFRTLLDTCYVSHEWERGHDYEYRADRLRAFLLFARWTGLAMIDVVRFRRDWLSKDNMACGG